MTFAQNFLPAMAGNGSQRPHTQREPLSNGRGQAPILRACGRFDPFGGHPQLSHHLCFLHWPGSGPSSPCGAFYSQSHSRLVAESHPVASITSVAVTLKRIRGVLAPGKGMAVGQAQPAFVHVRTLPVRPLGRVGGRQSVGFP